MRRLKNLYYVVYCKKMNACNHSIPQNRCRVFLVAILRTRLSKKRPFRWPIAVPLRHASPLECLPGDKPGRLPARHLGGGRCRRLVKTSFDKCKVVGMTTHVFMDIDCTEKYFRHSTDGILPCLTAKRGKSGGYWVSTKGRRLTSREMFRCQGFSESKCDWRAAGPCASKMGEILGKSMVFSCCETIVARLLYSAGLTDTA